MYLFEKQRERVMKDPILGFIPEVPAKPREKPRSGNRNSLWVSRVRGRNQAFGTSPDDF